MCWTEAVIEARKQMPAVTHYRDEQGVWKPLVARYETLTGDWLLDGGFLVGGAYSNHAGRRLQLGRVGR